MIRHIGIVAVSAEGAALCYRTICAEGAALLGSHAHPEISMHTYSLADYMRAGSAIRVHRMGARRRAARRSPPVGESGHLLRTAGFDLETYEEVPNAEPKRRAIYERYIARRTARERELGEDIVKMLMLEARSCLGLEDGTDYLAKSRRLFAVVREALTADRAPDGEPT